MKVSRSFILILLSISLFAACNKNSKPIIKSKVDINIRHLALDDVTLAARGDLVDALPFTGTLNAPSSAQVSAEVKGTARRVLVREGEAVKVGQTLAILDNEALRQDLLEQQAQMRNQRSKLNLASVKLVSQKELFSRGFISKTAFDEAQSSFAVSKGEVAVQLAKLANAQKSLNDTVLRSPISGVVYKRNLNQGEQVSPNQILFSIANLSSLEISAIVPSRYAEKVKIGQAAFFKIDGLSVKLSAKIVRINPVADNETRSFFVYLKVDVPNKMKVGQFVSGYIELNKITNEIILPLSAVNNNDKFSWVVLVKNGKLFSHKVKILAISQLEQKVAITGIDVGSNVISRPLLGLKDGDKVLLPNIEANQ